MVVNNILEKLNELGYSGYEGRVYLGLLQKNPVTAYEAAKVAAVPSSKIYQVINRLVEKGMIHPLEEEGRKKYIPLPPDEFLESRKEALDGIFSGLKDDFAALDGDREISFIWNMNNYDEFMLRAKRLINESEKNVLISVWNLELSRIEDDIAALKSREIPVAAVLFGGRKSRSEIPVFHHPIENTLFAERGGRGFALVADAKDAMVGTIFSDGRVEGAWSRNRGFVTLAEDYIKHDIYIMKIVDRYQKELTRRFGEDYRLLRDVFSDEEVKEAADESVD